MNLMETQSKLLDQKVKLIQLQRVGFLLIYFYLNYVGDRGDSGEKGDYGIKGDTGESGEKGSFGDLGYKGEKGLPGQPGPRVSEFLDWLTWHKSLLFWHAFFKRMIVWCNRTLLTITKKTKFVP